MKTLIKGATLNGKIVNILIEDNIFKKITEEPIPEEKDYKIIDAKNKAIMPAFYNTNTHLAMILMRGINDDKELKEWLKEDIWPREELITPNDVYIATKFEILEMIKGGSVFCSDMSKYPEETMKAINEMGIRGVISTPERDNEKGELDEKNDEENKKLLEEKKQKIIEFINMKNINEERIMKCISIPSIFTVSEEFLKFYSEVAKKNNMYIHIMVSETMEEVEYCKKNYGCSPIEKLEKLGLLTDKTILAYCVHVDDKDIELIKKYKCAIAHCPASNFKLKSGLMPFQKLLDAGILITLGTDSSASNNTVSMLEEMKISALNAKLQANKSSAGNVKDIFNTATLNGAKSYGINAGEIKEGKLADFVLYNLNHYLLLPNYNLLSNLVYSAQNDCITDVFCNGIQLMKDRKVEGEEKIMKDFRELSEKYRNVTASLGHN